jgi:carbonic anhydrase
VSPSLVPLHSRQDLLPEYENTPIAEMFGFHALGWPERTYAHPQLVIVTCMDARVGLKLPRTFAYVLQTAGARIRPVRFGMDYAISVAGVRAVALIGHDDCAMTKVTSHRDPFVKGLCGLGGVDAETAGESYDEGVETFAIEDTVEYALDAAARLRERYPGVIVAPLHYRVRDGHILQIRA